jgi:hypothetical protein
MPSNADGDDAASGGDDSDGQRTDDPGAAGLTADDAFALLGNDTRVRILEALGAADESLSFSALRDRVGTPDSGRFNYHLDKLVDQFVARTDDGYTLRRTGERIVVAVQSGAVTDAPARDPISADESCPYCGGRLAIRYREERLSILCPDCEGLYGVTEAPPLAGRDADREGDDVGGAAGGDESNTETASHHHEYGHLGALYIPPAGERGRDPDELLSAAHTWSGVDMLSAAGGVCPWCSASVETSVEVCARHDGADGQCSACGRRRAVSIRYTCPNCIYERAGAFGVSLLSNTDVLAFLTAHGVNPITPDPYSSFTRALDYDEQVVSLDPFEVRITFTIDGDALTVTVEDDDVTEWTRLQDLD